MTLLYRSPHVIIDAHEWHAIVMRRPSGKSTLVHRWRPLAGGPWQPAALWVGEMPKGFNAHLWPYRNSIRAATQSEALRAEALRGLPKVPTGAMVRNRGARAGALCC